jgi:hypothetical protein
MTTLIALMLLVRFEAAWGWWVAFALVLIGQFLREIK